MFVPLRRKSLYIHRLLDVIVSLLLRPLRYQLFPAYHWACSYLFLPSKLDSIFLMYRLFYFGFLSLSVFFLLSFQDVAYSWRRPLCRTEVLRKLTKRWRRREGC